MFSSEASELPDPEIAAVRRFQAGDEAAFETLVSGREAEIYRLALRMLGNPDDALEATQDAFLRAYRALPRFRGDAAFRTWLVGIAINVCRSRLTSRAARDGRRNVSLDASTENDALPAGAESSDPWRASETADLRIAVERALARLSPEHREIILLREMQGLEYEELAEALGCVVGTVKSRLARARGALRAALEVLWP